MILGTTASGYKISGSLTDSTLGKGITSDGGDRNPYLGNSGVGADIVVAAGVSAPGTLSAFDGNFNNMINAVSESTSSAKYLADLNAFGTMQGFLGNVTYQEMLSISDENLKDRLALALFYVVLRDAGRAHSTLGKSGYQPGEDAIAELFGLSTSPANIITSSRDIRTLHGGNINVLAPNGALTLQTYQLRTTGSSIEPPPPGIVTAGGGAIDIYTKGNVNLGISRIFTLDGGDLVIWSDKGNIAAGTSKKTVLTAAPTTVNVDPQSADVTANLAGLATGGGIGVLQAYPGAPLGNVDLITPVGVIDAGDAGIRSSGNLFLAATKVLNADNIQVSGLSVGVPPPVASSAPASAPAPAPAAPSAPASASAAAAAANTAATTAAANDSGNQPDEPTSIFSISIDGYGGGDGDGSGDGGKGDDGGGDGLDDRRKHSVDVSPALIQASL